MSGHYERGHYRGRRIYTEADNEWADRDEDAIADHIARTFARSRRAHPTFRQIPEDGDSSLPSEAERDAHPEAAW